MATIGNKFVDLIDLYKSQDDGQKIATVIELLRESNPILDDAMAVECNSGNKHRTTVRTGLPDITWGQLYKGIPQEKTEKAQVEDATGMAEALSTIDKRLLDLSGGNESAVRLSEARGFLEAMNQEVASTLFYGNVATDPEKFTGFAPRFNDTTAPNGGQIVNAGGTTANVQTSLWMIGWGDNANHLIYPKGTKAGVSREDKGEQRVVDGGGDAYYAKEELFRWHVGLSVRDWRYVARVANIEIGTTTAQDLLGYMRQAWWKINRHRGSGANMAIYCNSDVCELLDSAMTPTAETTTSYVRLTPDNQDGKEVMTYRGTPVRQVDALVNTEEVVS
jgi:hypothetical protein